MFRKMFISAAITTALASATPVLAQQDSQGNQRDYTQGGEQNSQGVTQDTESWDHEPGRESRNPGPDLQDEAASQLEGAREGVKQDAESWDHEPGRESWNPGPDLGEENEPQTETQ